MRSFFKLLLSDSDQVSSKRLVGVFSFIFLLASGVAFLFGAPALPTDYVVTFAGLVTAAFVGGVVEKVNSNNNEWKYKREEIIYENTEGDDTRP